MHSKMFRNQIEFYSKEEIPTFRQLMKVVNRDTKQRLSRRYNMNCQFLYNMWNNSFMQSP